MGNMDSQIFLGGSEPTTLKDLSDQLLKDFLDMDSSQIVTMHIQSVDQNRAIKTVKRTITELDRLSLIHI